MDIARYCIVTCFNDVPTRSELSLDWNIKVLQPVASASLSWMLRLVGSLKASEMKADCLMGALCKNRTLEATGTQSNLSHPIRSCQVYETHFCSAAQISLDVVACGCLWLSWLSHKS